MSYFYLRFFTLVGLFVVVFQVVPAHAQFDPRLQRYDVRLTKSSSADRLSLLIEAEISDARAAEYATSFVVYTAKMSGEVRKMRVGLDKIGVGDRILAFDENNRIQLNFQVPRRKARLQVPLRITASDGSLYNFVMTISLTKKPFSVYLIQKGEPEISEERRQRLEADKVVQEEVKASDEEAVDYSKADNTAGFWLGVGANFLNFTQTYSNDDATSTFSSFKGGSMYADFEYNFTAEWTVRSEYKLSPGTIQADSDTLDGSGDYNWTTISLEGMYFSNDGRFNLFGKTFVPHMRAGFQQHTVPILDRDVNGVATLGSFPFTTLAIGGGLYWTGDWRARYEFYMRYQYQMGSSGAEVSPSFAFDGSVGLTYPFESGLKLGLFWYGQFHTYSYVYTDSEEVETPEGRQDLFYSNVDLRIGFDF